MRIQTPPLQVYRSFAFLPNSPTLTKAAFAAARNIPSFRGSMDIDVTGGGVIIVEKEKSGVGFDHFNVHFDTSKLSPANIDVLDALKKRFTASRQPIRTPRMRHRINRIVEFADAFQEICDFTKAQVDAMDPSEVDLVNRNGSVFHVGGFYGERDIPTGWHADGWVGSRAVFSNKPTLFREFPNPDDPKYSHWSQALSDGPKTVHPDPYQIAVFNAEKAEHSSPVVFGYREFCQIDRLPTPITR